MTRKTGSQPRAVLTDCAIVYTMQIGGPAAAEAGGPQDPSHEDRHGSEPDGNRGTAAGSAPGQSPPMAPEGDEQGYMRHHS